MIHVIGLNCVGHGISVQTNELYESVLKFDENVKFWAPVQFDSKIKTTFIRVLHYFSAWLSVCFRRGDRIVVLANYWPFPTMCNVTIVMRHAHLVTDDGKVSLLDRIRRLTFLLSIIFSKTVVVQNQEMKKLLTESYSSISRNISVLPNPIRDLSTCEDISRLKFDFEIPGLKVIYPSGYYSHKGVKELFCCILNTARMHPDITLNLYLLFSLNELSSDELTTFRLVQDFKNVNILFIGKLAPNKLNSLFASMDLGVFPSKLESFGNGLYEMDAVGLPFAYTASLANEIIFKNGTPVFNWFDFDLRTITPDVGEIRVKNLQLPTFSKWFEHLSSL